MKDMVKRPQQRYDALFRELRMQNEVPNNASTSSSNDANDANDASDTMKTELKRYLMELNASSGAAEPQSHSLSNSNFIELGSVFQ